MNRGFSARLHYDRLLLAVAAAGLAASAGWLEWQQPGLRRIRAEPVAVRPSEFRHEPARWPPPPDPWAEWKDPVAQSPGAGWVYDVFTPPVIYYNGSTKAFSVTPAQKPGEAGRPFAVELVGVKLESYRLQLAGYIGAPGDYRAVLTSPGLSGTLLARAGQHFDRLGLTLREFAVRNVAPTSPGAAAAREVAAFAVVQDEILGGEVTLDSRCPRLTSVPLAVCRLPAEENRLVELHEGDSFSDGLSLYEVGHVQLEPASAVVVRRSPGSPGSETRTLRPPAEPHDRSAGEPPPAGSLPRPVPPVTASSLRNPSSHE